ncbi:MAG: 16S rRNA (cytidine(1402)-2'-O)-methyltransferase [Acholeplasmataceae bacterium]
MQKSFQTKKPTLYLVSTPIGNLKDITYRAIETLKSVDLVYAEDTRTSAKLFSQYEITVPLFSYHDHNKEQQTELILEQLAANKNIALISDAGTPGISDPGYEIILKAIEHNFHVVAIPGANAILTALLPSGILLQPFTFIGFLPRKKMQAAELLNTFTQRKETLIIYESPQRIKETTELLYKTLGNRKVTYARELTKLYETYFRTNLKDALEIEHNPKGEYVIVVEGTTAITEFNISLEEHLILYIKQGLTEKEAMRKVAKDRNLSKNELYQHFKIQK